MNSWKDFKTIFLTIFKTDSISAIAKTVKVKIYLYKNTSYVNTLHELSRNNSGKKKRQT